jgi:PPOX class probable F420-dependent enzyme
VATFADALVRELLDARHIAALATQNQGGSIHMVAVWYWFNGTHVFVATSSRSRKARNLHSNPKVSLMVDARDPAASCGMTVTGTAQILTGAVSQNSNAQIHRKYLSEAALADVWVRCSPHGTMSQSRSHRTRLSLGICARRIASFSTVLSRGIQHISYHCAAEPCES